MRKIKRQTTNIQKIFNNLFLVQLVLNITSCFCNIANGFFAGNFLDNLAISCNSLIIPYNMIILSFAYIFSSSSEILCGKYLGSGDKKSLSKIFTVVIFLGTAFSIAFTIIPYLMPTYIIKLLGGNDVIMTAATSFIYGYSIGIITYVLMPIFITFLNIENEGKHVTESIVLLAILYIVFGYTFTSILKLSYFGLGLANSLSQICTAIFLFARILKNKEQIFFIKTDFDFNYIKKILMLGIPSGYTGILISIRNIMFNNIIIKTGGVIAMSAYSVMLSGVTVQDAIITSCLNTTMIVTGICVGEKNKEELLQLIKHIFTFIIPINTLFVIVQIILSRHIASIYTSDMNVLSIANTAIKLYLMATIFEMCNSSLIATYTVFEKYRFVNIFNLLHCFVFHIVFSLVMSKYISYYAVFGSFLFAEMLSFFVYVLYSTYNRKHFPKTYYDLLAFEDNLDCEKKLYINMESYKEIASVSQKISVFCKENNVPQRKSNIAGLCTEEMVANIFEHGLAKKKESNIQIDVFVIMEKNNVVIRIRDNSIAFDPETRSTIFNPEDPTKNIGLRIVKNMSKDITYQNLFGLNNTIIKI